MSQDSVAPSLLRRAVAAAALGNAMEWFDFGLYNYLAVTIGRVFFPAADPGTQQIAALGTFAAAFLARPIGAAVFGPLGDRHGRQRVLAATMLLMSAATFSIALIPGHAQIGPAAAWLLLAARLVQGFSTGGEYGGAITFIAEYAPDARRGFYGSWLEFGTCGGFVLGACAAAIVSASLDPGQLDRWGWRVPFLLAGPMGLVGLYIRLHLEETPAFRALVADGASAEPTGWREVLRTQARPLILCVGLVIAFNIPDFIVLSYMPSYLATDLGVPEHVALLLSMLVLLAMMGLVPVAGHLSDRVGRRAMILGSGAIYLLLAVPCFGLAITGRPALIVLGLLPLGVGLAGYIGTMPATLAALFPTAIRYGALAIAYNIAISLFGGTSLPIVAWLVRRTGDAYVPAYYVMGSAAIGIVAALCMRESAGASLTDNIKNQKVISKRSCTTSSSRVSPSR